MSDILIGTAAIAYAEVNTYGCVGVGVFRLLLSTGLALKADPGFI